MPHTFSPPTRLDIVTLEKKQIKVDPEPVPITSDDHMLYLYS